MLPPVTAASLTTTAAFLPLMLIGGPIGNILFDIPLIMVCVIIASIIECFFVLPGHLRHTFHSMHDKKDGQFRQKLEAGFNTLRDKYFRRIIAWCIDFRWVVVAGLLSAMLLAVGLLAGGRIAFTFFPTPEGTILYANVGFVSGTPRSTVADYLEHLNDTLKQTQKDLNGELVRQVVVKYGATSGQNARAGDQFGSITVEMISPDKRDVRNKEFTQYWRSLVMPTPGLETLTISERRAGPPGRDVEVRLYGNSAEQVKPAALALADALQQLEGVSGIEDDMPYGREQLIYRLTPLAEAAGLTVDSVGRQLRGAFDGQLAQIFQDGDDEIEVRVMLPDEERDRLSSLSRFTLQLPNGGSLLFDNAVELETRRGFESVRRADGRLAVTVQADVDSAVTNANQVLASLGEETLIQISKQYGVTYSFEGRAADQRETLGDMQRGLFFAVILMYLILAWQFASYGWPLVVMSVIPFGLVGAITGHLVMDINLTILSLFGFFGLSGIVVNDSIVLVTFYRQLRADGMAIREALISHNIPKQG